MVNFNPISNPNSNSVERKKKYQAFQLKLKVGLSLGLSRGEPELSLRSNPRFYGLRPHATLTHHKYILLYWM